MPLSGAPSQSGDIKKWHNLYLDIKEMRCFKAELKRFWQIRGGLERERGVKDGSEIFDLTNLKTVELPITETGKLAKGSKKGM